MTIFRSSVEDWRPLITASANGKPVEFLLRWIDKESAGNPCSYTTLRESGIFQLDPGNMATVGTNEATMHPVPPCTAGAQTTAYLSSLSGDQPSTQISYGLAYVDWCIQQAQNYLAQAGYNWDQTSTSFWSMVKMVHVAPARIPVMLAQGLACNGGTPPADWDALMFCGPFPNTPQSWTDNAGDVGSYATGLKAFGTIPTSWWAFAAGIVGVIGYAWYTRRKKRHALVAP